MHIVQVSLASNIYPCFCFLHKTDLFFFTILTIFLFPQGSRLNCYSIYTLPYLLLAVVLTSLDTCHAPFFPLFFRYFPLFFLCLMVFFCYGWTPKRREVQNGVGVILGWSSPGQVCLSLERGFAG